MSRPAVAVDYDHDGICQAEFRKAMSNFPTGVAVLTAAENGTRYGMTVNSLTSVSLTPSLLLVCPKKGSSTGEALKRTGRFAVNILSADQEDLCKRFAGEHAPRFEGLEEVEERDALPLLPNSLVHLICEVYAVHPAGDHDIVVGRVTQGQVAAGDPLLFHQGSLTHHRRETAWK